MDETIEDKWGKLIPFASLIAVMAIGIALQKKRECVAKRMSVKFNKLWLVRKSCCLHWLVQR